MRIIPVIDLLGGVVVRGMGGRRAEYRPIESLLSNDAQPASVATAFVAQLGASTVYVADLDAIAGAPPNENAYRQIAAAGLSLWLDAGVRDFVQADSLSRLIAALPKRGKLILGLESLSGPNAMEEIVQDIGADQLIFSLDLKAGQPLIGSSDWGDLSPQQIATLAVAAGIEQMIVLDLADVGSGGGMATDALAGELMAKHPQLKLIGGGGVRGADDLKNAAKQGWHALLIASALHDGRLRRDDLSWT